MFGPTVFPGLNKTLFNLSAIQNSLHSVHKVVGSFNTEWGSNVNMASCVLADFICLQNYLNSVTVYSLSTFYGKIKATLTRRTLLLRTKQQF